MKLSARLLITLAFCVFVLPPVVKHFGLGGISQQKNIKETYEREEKRIEEGASSYKAQLLASVEEMSFADENLKKCVIDNISKYFGISDSRGHLQSAADLKHLECHRQDITSLEGLNALTKLESISLTDNDVEDAGPLASVDSLKRINLGYGNKNIRNIGDLSQLNNLAHITFPSDLKESSCSEAERVVENMESNSDGKVTHNVKSIRCLDN